MTHQNHQTNGASLEDCHTNFFALTDLCGIKWRKFVNGERPNASSEPLDDPILRSYSRCMQADILCVWRRVQSTKQENSDPNALPFEINSSKVHPPLSLASAKELWIFWYGEEPDLSELVDAELLKVAANQALWNGTYERGLTYECRSLLFKALHNLMERFVLTKDIVRFGKWFVQPCLSSDRLFGRSSQHLSFSFTFFVHGDTVCASIDLREHPAVRPLTKEHLTEAAAAFSAACSTSNNSNNNTQSLPQQSHDQNSPNSPYDAAAASSSAAGGNNTSDGAGGTGSTGTASPKPRKVILAPFGMAATLTGNSYKPSDPMAEKILEDWASFFPLCNKENSDVPPVVEVVSGGHKMYHPSIYVLVTDLDDMEEMEAAASQKGTLCTTSSAEAAALAALSVSAASHLGNGGGGNDMDRDRKTALIDVKPTITTKTTSFTNTVTVVERFCGSAESAANINSSATAAVVVVDHTKVQPYYDTLSSSFFTCNTTNTHAPPQAATEMPERGWQDCITNTLHVAYSCSATTAIATSSGVAALAGSESGGENSANSGAAAAGGGVLENSNQNNNNISNNNNSNNNANAVVDSKERLKQQLKQQLWGFIDPTQKAPCICTKSQSSNRKSSSFTTTAVGASSSSSSSTSSSSSSSSSMRTSSSSGSVVATLAMSTKPLSTVGGSISYSSGINSHFSGNSSHHRSLASVSSSTSSSSHQHHYQQQQLHYVTDSKMTRSNRIPFHKRQQAAPPTTVACIVNNNISGSNRTISKNNSKSQKSVGDVTCSSSSASAAFGCFYLHQHHHLQHTSDNTIPRQRALVTASATTPHGTPHGGASTYSRNSIGDSMPVPSVGSPGTPALSPHPNSTLSQPTSVPPADQILNMSPRGGAPLSVSNLQQPSTPIDHHLLDKNTPAPTPTDQHDKSNTASPYVVHPAPPSVEPPPSVDGMHGGCTGPGSVPPSQQQPPSVGRCTPTIGQQQQQQQLATTTTQPPIVSQQCGTISVKKFEVVHHQPMTPLGAGTEVKLEQGVTHSATTALMPNNCNPNGGLGTSSTSSLEISFADVMNDYLKLYKPPQLTVKDIEANDECLKLDQLYDFTAQDAWVNHPMKRFKPNEVIPPKTCRSTRTKNLYEGHTHFKPLMPSPRSVYGAQLLSIDAPDASNAAALNAVRSMGGALVGGGLVGIATNSMIGNGGGDGGGAVGDAGTAGGFFPGLDIKTEVLAGGTTSPSKEAKGGNASGGNLYTAEGLNPSLNDLEQLFETSSNDECGSVQIHTPPDSNNPSNGCGGGAATNTIDDLKRSTAVASAVAAAAAAAAAAATGAAAIAALQNCTGATSNATSMNNNSGSISNNSSGGANTIQAEDLTTMFPTPPSHEQHHPNSSPCQMDIQMTDLSVNLSSSLTSGATLDANTVAAGGFNKIKQEYSVELGSPVEEPIEDWSFVYRPPQQAKFVGSSKYAPLTNLPSQTLPPLAVPPNCVYKPSWTTQKSRAAAAAVAAAQQHQQQQQQQQLQQQQHQLQQHQQLQQQHHHQQLHELLSAAPRTPLQQPRTPHGCPPLPSPMHPNTVPVPLSSNGGGVGGSQLLLNQLNCPQAALTNTPAAVTMQQYMQRAGMSPISPARGSPMMQPQRQTPIHPPPPYEMAVASPATSTSSYLNKQYHSQEPPHTPHSVGGGGGMQGGRHTPHMHSHGGPHSVGVVGGGGAINNGGQMSSSAGLCHSSLAAMAARELPEVSSLIVNILLYDTALNVFRDHNFDSSTVCVCNADSQKVGNIRGADSGVYVPLPGSSFNPAPSAAAAAAASSLVTAGSMRALSAFGGGGSALASPASLTGAGGGGGHNTGGSNSSSSTTPASGSGGGNQQQHITGYVDDDPVDCTCGFSAVVNRRLAHCAGLFYEDEMEITGIAEDPGRHKKQSLLALITSLTSALRHNDDGSVPAPPPPMGIKPPQTSLSNNTLVSAASDKSSNAVVAAEQQAHAIFDLLLQQCSIIQTSSSSIHRALQRHRRRLAKQHRQPQSIAAIANVLEFVDANDIMCLALEQARLAYDGGGGGQRMDTMQPGDFGASAHHLHHHLQQHQQQHHHHQQQNHQHQQLSPFAPHAASNRRSSNSNAFGAALPRLSVHKWPYIPVGFTRSNKDIVRTMNSIQPMLQNAFHTKSRNTAIKDTAATYTVSGPLTWRQFHRLAGRASGQCEPQPIPSVIVGHDKDWISVAPLAIHYWDKFLLEPYSYAHDVVYLIVCPDNEYAVGKTRTYFRELSTTYEMCKLGRHTPMRGWNDGMLTVGRIDVTTQTTPLDDWLLTLDATGDHNTLAEKIRLYAHAFQNMLAPFLSRIPDDKTLLDPPECGSSGGGGSGRERGTTSPNHSGGGGAADGIATDKTHNSPRGGGESTSSTSAEQTTSGSAAVDNNLAAATSADTKVDATKAAAAAAAAAADAKPALPLGDPLGMGEAMEDINPPAIVLYVVEPFTFGSDSPELERLACIALLRCYSELLRAIPDSVRANLNIQIISLESILELGRTRNRKRFSDEIKCLALNIFSQCRRHMVHAQSVKSLTGFGTAANMEVFLKSKDDKNRQPYKMYTPPYILAPVHEKTGNGGGDKSDFARGGAATSSMLRGAAEQKYAVMYCNYCMSEDQSWLLATVTDDRGEMLEKVCINIEVPNRTRRRKAPARRVGLRKLMDFIMGVISQTAQPWRLVIGRIGRIGHSELTSWSYLLSKQNLQKVSKQLKDICKQCSLMYPPSILSACLVTLEPDAKLRVMPDQFTPDERFSQISMQNPLSTPQDVTCTHILVFPTSAVCLSFTRQFQNEPQVDLDNDFLNFDEEEENEGFTDVVLMGDLFWEPQLSRLSNHGSPDRMEDNRSWQSAGGNNFNSAQQQDVEEVGSINQQPLAVGYMVSTAPTGRMPSWFWSACPHLEDVCPVFLKTALHLHVPNIQTTDDILNSTNAHSSATDHPLDSTLTADVLRYVLEGYNALSWLALDSNTHDRLSCLPINVQTLMDLYYMTAAIA